MRKRSMHNIDALVRGMDQLCAFLADTADPCGLPAAFLN